MNKLAKEVHAARSGKYEESGEHGKAAAEIASEIIDEQIGS